MDGTGHRERLRQRFLSEGLEHFGEERALEYLLFYVIPRRDTYPLAKELIHQFGSLVGVMQASPEALKKVPGVGDRVAEYLHFTMSMYRYYMGKQEKARKQLPTLDDCAQYMMPRFTGLQKESVCVLCLDARCTIMGCKVLAEGEANSVHVPVRKVVEYALNCDASALVMAHNHPAGIALPSQEDIEVTKQVADALEAVGVTLLDHFIVASGDYVSLSQSGLIPKKG